LSDSSKRPGSRDISELKARLGLKKAPPPAAAKGNGVVPPPGVSLPAPPGAQPAGPVVPNAADDPFGAMNAMAQIGTIQRAPEIVIVNDGKPVEQVGAAKRTGTIVKYAIVALVPLGLGVAIGQIAKDAKFYNQGLGAAGSIRDNVKAMKKNIVALQTEIATAKKRSFAPDKDTTAKLDKLSATFEVKQDVFRATEGIMNRDVLGQMLAFYSGVTELRAMLTEHVKVAKTDDLKYAEAKTNGDGSKPQIAALPYKYGALLSAPSGTEQAPFGVKVVELGPFVCSDGKQTTEGCPNDPKPGIGYRETPGAATWTRGELQLEGTSGEAKKVILLLPTGTIDSLIRKTDPSASELLYIRRLEALEAKVEALITQANSAETKLNAYANSGERFTFFL
jgi:hypothetical protein